MTLGVLALVCLMENAGCSEKGPEEKGQTFRMALSNEPPSLDWSLATDTVSFYVVNNIMTGLTQFNDELKPSPAIAKDWKTSEDGRVITFYLRNDAQWSDGKPVTAQDFEYSWKRLLDPETAAKYSFFLFDIVNAQEYNSGKIKDPDQVGVKAVSDTELRVSLKHPAAFFPSITAFMVTFPHRKDIIERHGTQWTDPKHIVTNGPFLLKEWRHEYKLVLKPNPTFYEGPPMLDQVVMHVVRNPDTELNMYEAGELDMAELPPVAISKYQSSGEYVNFPLFSNYYYAFTVDKPPVTDPRVRRALGHAINRSRLPLILKGGEMANASWIPKGMVGYNPDIGLKFNPEKARALLAEAGYPGGKGFPKFTLAFSTDSTNLLVAQFVQAQWKKHLGLDVELKNSEWKVYLSMLTSDPPPVWRLSWSADFPDPGNFMGIFISTSSINRPRWKNPQYDQLMIRGTTEQDPAKRQALYDQAQRLLLEQDAVIIPLFLRAQNMLVKPYVQHLKFNAMDWLYLKQVSLSKN